MFGECFKLHWSRFQINVVYHRLSQRGTIPNLLGVVTSVISIKITKAKLKLYLFLFCQYFLFLGLWNHISARHTYLPHLTCLSSLFAYFLRYFFSFLSFEREITQRKCVSNKKLNLKKTIGYTVDNIETVDDTARYSRALFHLPMERYVCGWYHIVLHKVAMELSKMDNQINQGCLKI